jgi:hypothetical protein
LEVPLSWGGAWNALISEAVGRAGASLSVIIPEGLRFGTYTFISNDGSWEFTA